jgi:mutator family transposase
LLTGSGLRTAEGAIEYGVPQVADRVEPFVSRVRAGLAGRTAELEQLAVEMYARGLSTRDIEAAFRDASGASVLSRTAVSQVTERLWQEYEAFASRDLSEFAIAYFFVDGVAENARVIVVDRIRLRECGDVRNATAQEVRRPLRLFGAEAANLQRRRLWPARWHLHLLTLALYVNCPASWVPCFPPRT